MTFNGSTWLRRASLTLLAALALVAGQVASAQDENEPAANGEKAAAEAPAESSAPPPAEKVEDAKVDEAKVEEPKAEESKAAETKADDAKADEAPAEEAKADDAQAEAAKGEEKTAAHDDKAHDAKGAKGAAAEHGGSDHAGHDHGDHGDHGHDPYDLSHNNATAAIADPADVRFDMAIYSAVVFFLLLLILGKFAWGPISHGLDAREKSIADKIEQATRAAEEAAAQLKQYEAKLAAAADEARAIVAQAQKDGEATREKIVAEANASAQRERERAVADINAAKNEALREIAKQSVDTAIKLAGEIVKHEVKPAEHERLINEALSGFSKVN